MIILRICRTFPRRDQPGIGLQPFYCSELSRFSSVVFTKKIRSQFLKEVQYPIYEVAYRDQQFTSLKSNYLTNISKIWGELRMFASIVYRMRKSLFEVNVIHCHSIHYAISSLILGWFLGIPTVLSIGGTDIKRASRLKIYSRILKRFDSVVHVAKSQEKLIQEVLPKVTKLHISNGVDSKIFFDKKIPRKKQIISVGNIRWQKGYEYLMDAANLFLTQYDDYELVVIGQGSQESVDILKQRLTKSLRARVKFVGVKTQKEVNHMMNSSKLLVLPSVSEGLPKVLIESQAAGLPIVATDVGDCAEIVLNSGIIVECEDAIAISDAICSMIENAYEYKKYQFNCLSNAQNFSWASVVEKIDGQYEKIINAKDD